jgi:diacylglycerol kinase (ATP)
MGALRNFKYAFRGLKEVIKSEKNAKIHVAMAVLALIACLIFRISLIEFLFVFLSIVLVMFAEIINTAIEKTLDLISQENNHVVQLVKDMSAAAVLITAIGSIVVAGVVFLPKIIELIRSVL